MKGVVRWFNLSPLPENMRPEKKLVRFPLTPAGSGSLIRRREQNNENDNSASQLLFQVRILRVYSRLRVVHWYVLYPFLEVSVLVCRGNPTQSKRT